ncbi:MAG: DUF2975 domain-containing protein [Saprospiraceae bacterium]|jgi:hypothetical protein|nr:DUF2975 domain-containing protein [Saprospiraceae bacterium]MBP6447531.1 DUF2975 domain-containing protein [Saprospiraceae bacterium]
MSKKNDLVLDVLNVVSWIIFIGLCVEAGALIFNFVYTLFRPIATHNVYKGLDLADMYQNQFYHYVGIMSFAIVLSLLKAYLFYLVVKIFMKLNLVKPFSIEIAKLIEKISYEAFTIAIVSTVAHQYTERLIESGYQVSLIEEYWDNIAAFMMMAAIVFVISRIFNKGIEIQNENDLTV